MSMTATTPPRRLALGNALPALTGLGTLVAFFVMMELLIQTGVLSRFIIPPPSEIIASFPRVIIEEHVLDRFVQTLTECLTAGVMLTVFGVAGGVLMHRFKPVSYTHLTLPTNREV